MADFLPLAPLLEPDEPPSPAPVVSAAEIGPARLYVEASRAPSTRRAYDGDWSRFSRWCDERDVRLSDHAVARTVQARAAATGLDPVRYGGHSLRAGLVTAAARAGADVWKIQQVSPHRSMQVLSGHVRDARLFDDHAGEPFL